MSSNIRRIYVEKRCGFNIVSEHLLKEFKDILGISGIENVRLINRYDVDIKDDKIFELAKRTIFSEPNVDYIYEDTIETTSDDKIIAFEYLPGQYDQRADSAAQCIQILTQQLRPKIKVAKLIIINGDITVEELNKIKKYCINPVDSREASLEKPKLMDDIIEYPDDVMILKGFINFDDEKLVSYRKDMNLAMSVDDLRFVQDYFKNVENRDPVLTELVVIDTYWSDHCRHTTFLSEIQEIEFEEGQYTEEIKKAFNSYMETREDIYIDNKKPICLMDLATITTKEAKKRGLLDDLDESDEINACSIEINVDIDGQEEEKWLLMFKNETHNHPTEIEPFGGAATCLGGAIRDPLSGRSYVYQAMRISGCGDPTKPIDQTLPGKLPQIKITKEAARGYSSYGNQIGLATGVVSEIYDEGFIAKRMELGAVIGAAPKSNVVREKPEPGDIILLIGGRTGRDGCGGATGSSKAHTEESIENCGAEVQKGNPPEERKIQRLFRNNKVSRLIKKCNDFGAGGVSVAIGELADSLEINLDAIQKKYEGLDGTELAISESQERMAVVINKEDVEEFISLSNEENLEASVVAEVTDTGKLIMKWRDKVILNLSREFLNSNGAKQYANVKVCNPTQRPYFEGKEIKQDIIKKWSSTLTDLNVCDNKGLVEMFDSTIGAGTVTMPYGGKYCNTPTEGMVSKIPVLKGDTSTCSLMSYGYNPMISKWSPFHGGIYAVLESIAKIVSMGGDINKVRFSLQEFFERLEDKPEKWGKPFSALLGSFYILKELGLAAIGGKDSMSGTFNEICVPPTLVSFAVTVDKSNNVITPEFKKINSDIVVIKINKNNNYIPDFHNLKKTYTVIKSLCDEKLILSAKTVEHGGIASAISKMSFGNMIGMKFENNNIELFSPDYGDIIIEVDDINLIKNKLSELEYIHLGKTIEDKKIVVNNVDINLEDALNNWKKPLNKIFPSKIDAKGDIKTISFIGETSKHSGKKIAAPRVFIPAFPGTNCEYDSSKAFENAGGIVDTLVFRNLTSKSIEESIDEMVKRINNSQIIMLPGGFSAGDEPDGSGKFIATVFRNPFVKDAVMELIKNRDGLILGICNGFQALIKLGLVPYGEIRDLDEESPTLTYNKIGRHISCMPLTRISSNLSPWFNNVEVGDTFRIPMSHGEGRFVANEKMIADLEAKGQIATQYVDYNNNASYDGLFNPNGSVFAIEGITSPDGRILGKMGHSERIGNNVGINVPGEKDQKLFDAGVKYYG